MAKIDSSLKTHEGATAVNISPEQQLRRSVMSCMLWEDEFYEDGKTITDRIASTIPLVNRTAVANLASVARKQMKLRHVPLFIVRELARKSDGSSLVSDALYDIIDRPDELSEFLSMYWKDGKCPISSQVKKGLARAFTKFDEYQLAKYNRDEVIKLRDVLFMCHAKPVNAEQTELWKKLAENELETPDTWEVASSKGENKKDMWERLIKENKLGALALLRNLRNMQEVSVSNDIISSGISKMNTSRVLPFRFISAVRYATKFESELETAMLKSFSGKEKIPGHTVILIDVSGSMDRALSDKSDMNRMDAACGVAMFGRELCEKASVYAFSTDIVEIPARRGFALRDAIVDSQKHRDTYMSKAIKSILAEYSKQGKNPDRIIVITDEQAGDDLSYKKMNHESYPIEKAYMVNVASYKNGVGYGSFWTHLDGFSEAILDYILQYEKL